MPISLSAADDRAVLKLEGIIAAEDTDEVVHHLRELPGLRLDLSGCEHLHTAVLQAILMLKPKITALPPDPFWGWCLTIHKEEEPDEDDTAG